MLVSVRGPVGHTLRHRVGLIPDDVRAHPPAYSLSRNSDTGGNQTKVFRLEASRGLMASNQTPRVSGLLAVLRFCRIATHTRCRITVSNIPEAHAIGPQHAPNLFQD